MPIFICDLRMRNSCNLSSNIINTDLRGEIKFDGSWFAGGFTAHNNQQHANSFS